jgi:phenylpropionate dioxygenase-like ring-hydroxylating dioxygenase large terminal subunit
VLFRSDCGSVAVLPDRCPHRHAPLSAGRVCNGQIQCPYHGWRFDHHGICTEVPGGHQKNGQNPLLTPFETREDHGLVWVRLNGEEDTSPPVAPAVTSQPIDIFFMTSTLRCSLLEAAENFLDGFHTHFVHAGWVRRDTQRQTIEVEISSLGDGIEARYTGEGRQSGLISKLLERHRGTSMGRFRLPGLAEIEYRNSQNRLTVLISVWLTPENDERIRIHARIATPQGWAPLSLKKLLLQRLFGIILRQDKIILEKTHANIQRHKDLEGDQAPPLLSTELDLLGPWIKHLLDEGQVSDVKNDKLEVSL